MLFAEKEAVAREAARAAFDEIAALEDVFSDYRSHSEISRLGRSAFDSPFEASEPLFTVLEHAQNLSQETGGAFDITVGPYVALWRKARKSGELPPNDSLFEAGRKVGWERVLLDPDSRSVRLTTPEMQLDAGGLAKGYILDAALQMLRGRGVASALIEAGGDIVVGAPPPGKTGWTVDVPDAPAGSAVHERSRSLANAAIATSGDTRQFVEIDGMRYSHVVDPKTGLGLQTRRMATVIAPDGMTADGYATALTVMEPDKADSLLAVHPELTALVRVPNAE